MEASASELTSAAVATVTAFRCGDWASAVELIGERCVEPREAARFVRRLLLVMELAAGETELEAALERLQRLGLAFLDP